MFSTFCMRLNGPIAKLSLFCAGTLIRLETGFCVAFARLAVPPLSSAAGFAVGCVASCCASQQMALQANPHNRIVSSRVFRGQFVFASIRFASAPARDKVQ